MKLILNGHDERYTVEQSLMALFPGELPVYEPVQPGDDAWAVIACGEETDCLSVSVELHWHGKETKEVRAVPGEWAVAGPFLPQADKCPHLFSW